MATAREKFHKTVNDYIQSQTGNISLEEHIKKGKEFIAFLTHERQKHIDHIRKLEEILTFRKQFEADILQQQLNKYK